MKNANTCLNMTIAFLLVATVISLVVLSIRYNEISRTIAEVTAEIEKQNQIRAVMAENEWLNINEDDLEKILRDAKPPCPLEVRDSIIIFQVNEPNTEAGII